MFKGIVTPGILKIESFKKTNGIKRDVDGVQTYAVEYKVELSFPKGWMPQCVGVEYHFIDTTLYRRSVKQRAMKGFKNNPSERENRTMAQLNSRKQKTVGGQNLSVRTGDLSGAGLIQRTNDGHQYARRNASIPAQMQVSKPTGDLFTTINLEIGQDRKLKDET